MIPRGLAEPHGAIGPINARCPSCKHNGAFMPVLQHDARWEEVIDGRGVPCYGGTRRCPNRDCGAIVFFTRQHTNGAVVLYPPELIDFDATALPPKILSTIEEAILAHSAGCFRASTLMVRRLLEELCDDKEAHGKDLKARLGELGRSVIIPRELLDAADHLRLMGNDAAHVYAKDYDKIDKEEAELAIELAKELLKAVYQYTSLLSKLTALKKPAGDP
jgi:HEPN domain-containing protein